VTNFSKKISINTKILLLVVTSSFCVLSFSLYISNLSKSTKEQIETIGNQRWPVLDKTRQLQFHFDHLVEQLHQAVASHEKENIFQAEAEMIAIKDIISDLSKRQPQLKPRGDRLQQLVSDYFDKTRQVTMALINNNDDASNKLLKEQESIKEKAILISDALYSWNAEAESKLVNLLKLTEGSALATSNAALIGCVFVMLLGLLSYWTYHSNLIVPIQRLTLRTKRICEGQLDKITDNELENQHDEFSQMAKALSDLLDHLQKSNSAFKEQNEKLIASTKAKSAFLANMSHEIRTPLASIIGFSEELLEDQNMPLEQRQAALSTIIQGGNHLRNIINDILDISKIEADKLQIALTPVNLIELISEIRDLISMQSMKKGLEFYVEFKNRVPESIDADALRLKQILLNLCSNACKFSDYGKVSLSVEYSDLTNVLSFAVTDTGIGISAAELPHIFDEFYQADSSASRKYGGTGLGLPISKKLANMMDGDITAQSTIGKGSTFILKINAGNSALGTKLDNVHLNEPLIYQLEQHEIETPISENYFPNRVKVLLAEDTPDNQRLITMFLKRYNIDLVIVDNGKKAVEEARKNVYDVLLMDIQMPYMNGIEATELLLKTGYDKPIIAVTANAMQDDISLYKKVGFSHVVAKPIVKKLLVDAIEHHIDKPLQSIDSPKPTAQVTAGFTEKSETAAVVPISNLAAVKTGNDDVAVIRNVIEQLRRLEQHLSSTDHLLSSGNKNPDRTGAEQLSTPRSLEPVVSTLFEDDPELLTILNKYLEDLKIAEKDIMAAYQAQEWETLKSHLHKVKGTGGAFGYPSLSEIAKEIHQHLLNNKFDELAGLMLTFQNYCQRIFLGANIKPDRGSSQQAIR